MSPPISASAAKLRHHAIHSWGRPGRTALRARAPRIHPIGMSSACVMARAFFWWVYACPRQSTCLRRAPCHPRRRASCGNTFGINCRWTAPASARQTVDGRTAGAVGEGVAGFAGHSSGGPEVGHCVNHGHMQAPRSERYPPGRHGVRWSAESQ